jgi:microcystin-dependent protein
MGTPYVGEIRIFAGNFAPAGWAFCDGSLIPISENETMFNLIGTTYGGDGTNTFALPDLRSRVPVHMGTGAGQSYVIAQSAGVEQITLTTQQIPAHNHPPTCNSGAGNQADPTAGVWAQQATVVPYANAAPTLLMAANAIGLTGGSQPHDNMVPFLVINFIISLFGIFPSQT